MHPLTPPWASTDAAPSTHPTVKRVWRTQPMGRLLELSLSVEVNGYTLRASQVIDTEFGFRVVPTEYVERELRNKLMHSIADYLLGPAR